MIALLLLAQAFPVNPLPAQRAPSVRECAVNFTAIGLTLDEQRKKDKDAKTVRRVRDALVAKAAAEGADRATITSEAAAQLAAAKTATDRSTDTEIDFETCFALAGVAP